MTKAISPPAPANASGGFLSRVLDPVDSLVEGIYSVLIVLTFTLAIDVSQANGWFGDRLASQALHGLFVASFGCAVAWGLIDGIMYVLISMLNRGEERRLLRAMRKAADEEEAIALLADQMDDTYARFLSPEERDQFRRSVYARLKVSEPPRTRVKSEDLAGAVGVALVAVAAALPVVLPLLMSGSDPVVAVRLSNLVAFALLFWMGQRWGKRVGAVPWQVGLALMLVGVSMMVVAIPLGG